MHRLLLTTLACVTLAAALSEEGHAHDHAHRDHKHYYGAEQPDDEPAAEPVHVHDHAGHDHAEGPPPAHDHHHDHDDTQGMIAEEGHSAAPTEPCNHDHDHAGHDHASHDHAGHDHTGHDHASHDHNHDAVEDPYAHETQDSASNHGSGGLSDNWEAQLHATIDEFLADFVPNKDHIVWVKAIVATLIISLVPAFILIFVPINDASEGKGLLKVLLSFAAGGLLGDAFLHLIPHAIDPHDHGGEGEGGHDHDHGHDHGHGDEGGHDHSASMWVGLGVLSGILAFMILEKAARAVNGGHGHSHAAPAPKAEATDQGHSHGAPKAKKEEKEHEHDASCDHEAGGMKVAGYLNLAADFTHNFTDGLALGAAFLHPSRGPFKVFLAVLLHEVPHEIGDFAILVESGCTKWQAIRLQMTTALGAMAGAVCGLMSEEIGKEFSAFILPFTAGGFIYIATVGVIPELLEDSSFMQSVYEVVAFCLGVATMVGILYFE